MAQQKQRKQLILTDDKNIFSYCFQPIQRSQPNFTTDGIRNFMALQKQRKKLILTGDKNIFTYRFQRMQRLQPNFKTDVIRSFMYTKLSGDSARIFSFIPQQNVYNPINFMNHTYQTTNFIHHTVFYQELLESAKKFKTLQRGRYFLANQEIKQKSEKAEVSRLNRKSWNV